MVADTLRQILASRGLTQAQAGEIIGVPQPRIAEMLAGKKPTLSQFLAMRDAWPEIDAKKKTPCPDTIGTRSFLLEVLK